MKRKIFAGTTSFIERVFIRDTSQTTKVTGLTGLAYNSAGLTAYWIRSGDSAATPITLATATVGTWATGGFKEVDAAHMPGWYEIGIPNAAIAAGATSVGLHLRGATNMEDVPMQYELDAVNYQDSVRFGLTALPNAAVSAAGGLLAFGTGTGQLNPSGGNVALTTGQNVATVAGLAPPSNWNLENIDASGRVLLQPSQVFNNTGQTTKYAATLASGDVTGNLSSNIVQIAGQTASAAAGVTFPASIGTSTFAVGQNVGAAASVTAGVTLAANQAVNTSQWGGVAVTGMPLAATSYVAPDNTDIVSLIGRTDPTTAITAIKTATDKLTFDVSNNVKAAVQTLPSTVLQSADHSAIQSDVLTILDAASGVESTLTLRQAMRLMVSVLSGKAAVSGSTVTFKRLDGTTTALTVVNDTVGNRTSSAIGTV